MNQILYTGKTNKPSSLNSIIRFFAVCLILLGLIFIGKGSYALYQDIELGKRNIENNDVCDIQFEREENNAIVTISHVRGISKVKYHWNNEEEQIIQGDSKETVVLDDIKISNGTNTLYVTGIDINGKATDKSYEYSYEGTYFDISIVNTSGEDSASVKISATDVKGISYVTYTLNNEDEITIYPDNDNTKLEHIIEVPLGENELSITAINTENKISRLNKQKININRPPKVSLYLQNFDVVIIASDEDGIDHLEISINDSNPIKIDANGEQEFTYRYDINGYRNSIFKVTAVDMQGAPRTYRGLTD